ncbi:replicative DNA helicase [Borreliella californiensis]|uniref:Replicative DNA helicase n=1 Tax=Borreliella californiensis TaxID=373543 RepID=A0A7W9ZLE9_9SPIR|nr:replicative DNA helicase [Borreliella californiensis]MBB6213696.1 replicative DNA helicase [Borreliella californiensis]
MAKVKVIVAKNRGGATVTAVMDFIPKFTKFIDNNNGIYECC